MKYIILLCFLTFFVGLTKAQKYSEKQTDSVNDAIFDLIQNDPKEGIRQSLKINEYSKKINYSNGEIQSLENIAYAYYSLGDFKKVIEYSSKEEERCLQTENYYFLCAAIRLKAAAYASTGFYDEARKMVAKAFKYTYKIKDPDKLHKARSSLYDTYSYVEFYNPSISGGNTDSMFTWNKKSLQEHLKIKKLDPQDLLIPYTNLAKGYIDRKQFDSAQIYLNKAFTVNKKYLNKRIEADINFQFGRINALKGNYRKAIDYYQKSYKINLHLNDPYETKVILKNLYECYEKAGDKDEANQYYIKWHTLEDSIHKAEKKNIDIPLKEIVKENKQALQSEKNNLYYIIIGSVLLLIISLYFIVRYIKNYKKEKQEKEKTVQNLTAKEEKLSELELKVNDSFEEVLELAKNDDPAFLSRFKEVYPEFYNKLISAHPDLTTGQMKFCAQLKLNFSAKEIASYTHVTTASIEKKKNRLRKQLNIPSEVDLNKWMMEF